MSANLATSIDFQLFLTIMLCVVTWGLYNSLERREFLRWWAWGWLWFAVSLLLFRISLFGSGFTQRMVLHVATVPGHLQVLFFALGVDALRSGRSRSARWRWGVGVTLVALGLVIDSVAPSPMEDLELAVAARGLSREIGLGAVFPWAGFLLARHWKGSRPLALGLTVASFILYGLNEIAYTFGSAHTLVQVLTLGPRGGFDVHWMLSSTAFAWDILWQAAAGLGWVLLMLDDHAGMHRALEEAEERFRTSFDLAPTGIALVSLRGTVIEANRALATIVGKNEDELVRQSLTDFAHPEDRNLLELSQITHVDAGMRVRSDEVRLINTAGEVRQCVIRSAPVSNAWGDVLRIVVQVQDVTEQRDLESRLRRARQAAALGELAAGVAHDFNNTLTAIQANAQLLEEEVPAEGDARTLLQEIVANSERAARGVDHLLAFAGKSIFKPVTVDVGEFLRREEAALAARAPEGVCVRVEIADGCPSVHADIEQVRRAVRELTTNAIEALSEAGGSVTLRTYPSVSRPEAFAYSFLPDIPEGEALTVLSVEDDGSGLDVETEERMFEPFFTRRFLGRGLGLAGVLGIARRHLWAIDVRSVEGRGTEVSLHMPGSERILAAGGLPAEVEGTAGER